jgi:hypothetical protein
MPTAHRNAATARIRRQQVRARRLAAGDVRFDAAGKQIGAAAPPVDSSPRKIARELTAMVRELDRRGELEGLTLQQRREVVDAAREAMRTQLRNREINERIGPLYTLDRTRRYLGVGSRQAVDGRVKRRTLLRVVSADGVSLFPALQFAHGTVKPALPPFLDVLLGSGADPWTALYWLTAPARGQDGPSVMEVIDSGDQDAIADLLDQAARDAAGWSGALAR